MMRNVEGTGADVVVVGGGVAGLAAARELARCGAAVTLVERGRLGGEASHAAAGMLSPQVEADARDEFFELTCAARDAYPAFADELREETGVDVELDRAGTLYLAFSRAEEEELERRYEWQSRAGLAVERLTAEEALSLEPRLSPRVRVALRFPRDWQVENRRLVTALAASAERRGVRTLTATEVTAVRVGARRVRGVETSRGFLPASKVLLAAGAWVSLVAFKDESDADGARRRLVPVSVPRVEPVRGQILCFDARPPVVRHVVYSPRGYVVPRRDGRLLAGSTIERAGFDKSLTGDGVRAVAELASEISLAVGTLPLVDAWAGLRPRAEDGLPVLGASAEVENLFLAAGYYRNGILLAPVTGELIAGMITGGAPPAAARLLEPFSPERFRRALAGSCGE